MPMATALLELVRRARAPPLLRDPSPRARERRSSRRPSRAFRCTQFVRAVPSCNAPRGVEILSERSMEPARAALIRFIVRHPWWTVWGLGIVALAGAVVVVLSGIV